MSTAAPTEVLLGCDPQVRVVIIEDAGNLVVQVYAEDPAVTDIDALFFNLSDDIDLANLTIFPEYDESIGSNGENVTGFEASTIGQAQLNNGAQIQEAYDVKIEYGTQPYSTGGDVDQAALTIYVDGGGAQLTAASIDTSNMTAVINSDDGNGLALTNGGGGGEPVYETTTVLSENFDGLQYASQSADVAWNDGWQVTNGALEANGHNDGNIWFQAAPIEGNASISFDARAPHTEYFENGGCYGDSLEVWALIDGSQWALLDTYVVNADGTALVGDTTGQTITANTQTLSYSGGALDGASSVQLVLDADISAGNEEIFVDNVAITDTVMTDPGNTSTVEVENTVLDADFEGIHYASQSDAVEWNDGWQVTNGELEANGCADGNIWFDSVAVDGPATVSFDARAPHTEYFENGGCYGDSLEVWALIDGSQWALLDTYVVNAEGTALVGDTTGQTITADSQTLSYSGGVLDDASSVQLVLDADISAANEEIFVDNLEITETFDVVHGDGCEDFEGASAGDVAADQFEGFTVSGQRTGDAQTSENDAMIFDTANPTGGDTDLGYAGQGNAIIISEDNDSSDPDDNAHGGQLTFEFDDVSDVESIRMLDIEEAGGSIDLYDADGGFLSSVAIPAGSDNGVQDIEIGVDGVQTMVVNLVGSGAVDDVCFTPAVTGGDDCQYAVTYDDLMNQDPQPEDPADDPTQDDLDLYV